jgi:LacI family transcriptional regulator
MTNSNVRRPPTIYEVASKAKVSIKTVSRVLNGEPNVRPKVHERVRAAVNELGYRPKMSARGLAGGRSFTLVTFLDEGLTMGHWRIGRSNPYVERLQFAGMLQCRESGYHLLVELLNPRAPNVEQQILSTLSALNPDGVILTPPISEDPLIIAILERSKAPFARLSAAPSDAACLTVTMDERGAAIEATDHLLDLGHTRIAFIAGGPGFASSTMRAEGYRAAMAARGVPVDPALMVSGDYTFESGKTAAAEILKLLERPTAVFAANDEMALGVVHEALSRGVSTPQDLSVIGFDDFPSAQYSIPPLTTVRQPVGEMAALAVQRLIDHAATRAPAMPAERAIVPHDLILRRSTCPPRGLAQLLAPAKKTKKPSKRPASRR